jgi:hypothetical protein
VPPWNGFLPIAVLAGIAPVLTELLSGNIPAKVFFLPWVYIFLLLVYGVPALLARELFIRWNLGLPGLFLLGLAYGIYNEGVCAKTLLRNVDVPISAFDHHAWHGINFPWAALIVPWHAFHAIIFPIALISWGFPGAARTSWLSRRMFTTGSILLLAMGTVVYLANKKQVTSPIYLVIFLAAIAALVLLSRRVSHGMPFLEADRRAPLWAAVTGFTFYPVFVVGVSIAAGMKLPGIVVCLLAALILAAYYRTVLRRGGLSLRPFVLFALGDYSGGALFTGLVMFAKGSWMGVLSELVLMGIFTFLITKTNEQVLSSPVTKTGLN